MSKKYLFIAISLFWITMINAQNDTMYIHKNSDTVVRVIPTTDIDSITFLTNPNYLLIHKTNEDNIISIKTSEIDSIVFFPPLPVADYYVIQTSEINAPVIFTDSSMSYGKDGYWSWDFDGDGVEDASGKGSQSYIYTEVGVYSVSLTVTDEFGISVKIDTIKVYEELVSDIDENKYGVIKIGSQYWMAENLSTTRYNNGDTIPNIPVDSIWYAQTEPAFCWLNNNHSKAIENNYGALYNTFVAQSGNVCPSGWHVPSDEEWNELEFYLAQNGGNYDSTLYLDADIDIARSKIAKSIAGTVGWDSSSVEGSVGNNTSLNSSSGFSGYTVGSRAANGTFNPPGMIAGWWTSDYRFAHTIAYNQTGIDHRYGAWHWAIGFSIRCTKDTNQLPSQYDRDDKLIFQKDPIHTSL